MKRTKVRSVSQPFDDSGNPLVVHSTAIPTLTVDRIILSVATHHKLVVFPAIYSSPSYLARNDLQETNPSG